MFKKKNENNKHTETAFLCSILVNTLTKEDEYATAALFRSFTNSAGRVKNGESFSYWVNKLGITSTDNDKMCGNVSKIQINMGQ